MKKFILPVLVIVFLVSAFLVGVFLYKNSGNRRFVAEKGEEIEVRSEKMEDRSRKEKDVGSDVPEWVKRYLKPGVQYRGDRREKKAFLINGTFEEFQEIAGSKDKYLVLKAKGHEIPLLRVVFQPNKEKGIVIPTEVNLLHSQAESLVAGVQPYVKDISQLNEQELQGLFLRGVWLSVIPYKRGGEIIKDERGAYYVISITLKGN